MSIAIAEFVKHFYNRKKKSDDMIKQLSGFEEIVRTTVIDKSSLLSSLLDIEIYFFARNKNDANQEHVYELLSIAKNKKDLTKDQYFTWVKNNHLFGEAIDNTKDYTDKRFDKKPRIKINMETGQRYLDKAKFLTKFSCFDGYMQYVDSKWDAPCHGIEYSDFKQSLKGELETNKINNRQSVRSNFYNNYLTEEMLVKKVSCGGYLEQPICIYDFTIKTMSHDCLNFSTRHLTQGGKSRYIETNYIKKPVRPSRQNESNR